MVRTLLCLAVGALLALPASAGVRVRVEVGAAGAQDLPFLVTASTHHYDLHNGNSRTRGEALTAPGRWQLVETGLRSPLLLAKVSVRSFHPAYLHAASESESWTKTLVGARMPVLHPVAWREALAEGPLPATGAGPSRARLADHVRVLHDDYLEHLDAAGIPFAGEPFDALRALVAEGMAGADADDPHRLDAERRLETLARFLEHPREARIRAALYRRGFGPKPVAEQYLDAGDQDRIQTFLDTRGPNERQLAWLNETTSIHYVFMVGRNVHLKERPGEACTSATLDADGGKAAGLDDARMQTRVHANVCRKAPGAPWTWTGRYQPRGWPR